MRRQSLGRERHSRHAAPNRRGRISCIELAELRTSPPDSQVMVMMMVKIMMMVVMMMDDTRRSRHRGSR